MTKKDTNSSSERLLSLYEERLVKLVHLLSSGNNQSHGLNLNQVRQFLIKPLRSGRNALEELEKSEKLIEAIEKKLLKK
jgi:hypothetical protein